jgi:ribonuclease D
VTLITTTSELALACQRFSRHPFVAVDTEFMRETTFWPILCVVQVASSDEALAIDALAPGLDLTPLIALMADANVVKVFHAARQDVEIFWKIAGRVPSPMFDTQVAAMVCGYGDQVSYGELAKSICRATVDKSSRFTDWARRPLAQAQIDYAIGDVTHLRDIYRALEAQLEKSGRLSWLENEMKVLTSAETYQQPPERAWERFKTRARKPRDLAVLMDLAAWRENEAQTRDVPRARVLKDDVLIEVALAAPRTQEALGGLRAFPRGMERSRAGEEILAAIERGLARDPKTLPKLAHGRRNGAGSAATVELLKVLLRQASDESGVAGKMIATVGDLEAIAADDDADVPALRGWRRKLFGARALELKRGNLALTVENGRVLALEWREADGEAVPAPAPSALAAQGATDEAGRG